MGEINILFQNPVAVLREEFDDWAVLYNPDTSAALGINPTGVAIWKMADGRSTTRQIIQKVLETYDQAPETAPQEIAQYIDRLVAEGFLGYQVNEKA